MGKDKETGDKNGAAWRSSGEDVGIEEENWRY